MSAKTVAVVGGGFGGSLFAIKLLAAQPDCTIHLVEPNLHLGRGLAYGAAAPHHLLNVPVSRMEVGLQPGFEAWLRQRPGLLAEALKESGGKLEEAFVPRQLFGDYIQQQIGQQPASSQGSLRRIQGTVASITQNPRRLILSDGRSVPADTVVLATGHLPSRFPFKAQVSDRIVAHPWASGALTKISASDRVLLLGSGLTAVDTILSLRAQGHIGTVLVLSRHGFLPRSHQSGGTWPAFLDSHASPVGALRAVRAAVRQAQAVGVPWQRVFDAVRPVVASVWHGWSIGQRAQFLRHLRAIWDVHRHRMPRRVAAQIDQRVAEGSLEFISGRLVAIDEHKDGVTAMLRMRDGQAEMLEVGAVINCTGPQMDLRKADDPLLTSLLHAGLVKSDPLGLGLESEDCAVRGADGSASAWLHALGALTRPAWWEIIAVPEINAQIDRLVHKLSETRADTVRPLAAIFMDIGAGI